MFYYEKAITGNRKNPLLSFSPKKKMNVLEFEEFAFNLLF
jgi:hypothetical protein